MRWGSMPLLNPSTQTEIAGMKIPKPQSNSYPQSASVSTDALKSQTMANGHNSFRPDIYRVTNGYVA